MEFHIARGARERYRVDETLFNYAGNVVFANVAASRALAQRINQVRAAETAAELAPERVIHGGALFAMGLIDELSHAMIARYRETLDPEVLQEALQWFAGRASANDVERLLMAFTERFPNTAVYRGEVGVLEWLRQTTEGTPNREVAFEEMLLLWLANLNPAFKPFQELFDDSELGARTVYPKITAELDNYFATRPEVSPAVGTLLDALKAPILASPDSLTGQLEYIRENWAEHLGEELRQVLMAVDVVKEEDVAIWMRFHPASGAAATAAARRAAGGGAGGWQDEGFEGDEFVGYGPDGQRRRRLAAGQQEMPVVHEYEAFSPDQAWMPTVVLIAKSTYVWLEQLSRKYGRHIHRLDQIPDDELQVLADRGLNGLWLIGLWERSVASQTIKRMRGQADAVASAYSVADYRIAEDLGGDDAYRVLRDKAAAKGIRLASDMVPNHMGIDSTWVMEHPEWFLSVEHSPFPVYSFEGPDLSRDSRVEIKIEDHYFDQTDAAVVFRRRERSTGETRFVYHGNDGTTFAWNDTAQLDYSKAVVREQVMQTILAVARLFPIIRFDAAMVLAKKHVQRLWFPIPGVGGSIPSRAEWSMTNAEFDALMPHEFWREVVDRVAVEVPGTLLLAEAFWLLEGYFVRTLGMHRVYNSAFMNMLRDEENAKYRSYLKKTIEFDPDILKRYVNFMSNPDERTAIDQFGTGDRYFGVATLLATLPGLPMFGHGQIEAFTEKYGMEYKTAKMDEWPNEDLMARHQREIAPLLKNRKLFAESGNFVMYDFWTPDGVVDENVFAYSNRLGEERAIILFHNRYAQTRGTIHVSAESMDKGSGQMRARQLAEALGLAASSGGSVVSYKDTTTGLEYLRHTWQIEQQGLAFDLRAYQYAVLQGWREMQSTAERPWDRLCDALHGAGVYNLEEALSLLQLRPVHEALRQMLSAERLRRLIAIETKGDDPTDDVAAAPDLETEAAEMTAPPIQLEEELTLAKLEVRSGNAGLEEFLDHVEAFVEAATASGVGMGRKRSRHGLRLAVRAVAGLMLPERTIVELPAGYEAVLPMARAERVEVWAPVFAWAVLRHLGSESGTAASAAELFDVLQLRAALAETFSALGMDGEGAWKAAARVRVALRHRHSPGLELATAIQRTVFWEDADVRWLTGVHAHEGKEYVNKELFEQLILWLLLPEWTEAWEGDGVEDAGISAGALNAILLNAEEAGYDVAEMMKLPPVRVLADDEVPVSLSAASEEPLSDEIATPEESLP